MNNFLKKLARFSLKHSFWGKFENYKWVVAVLDVAIIACLGHFVDYSSWSTHDFSHFVGIVVTIAIVLFIATLFLPLLVNIEKQDLPELVIPQVQEIRRLHLQYGPIIDRLIRIAYNDDDANLLRRWIDFFNTKKWAEEKMASFEMQFLSKS